MLDINPREVFSLRVSDEGVLPALHPLTKSVPLGFSEARMVAGSSTRCALSLKSQGFGRERQRLFVDLREDDVLVP